jgi:NDP-sugar pyrophosphorylase family protein
VTLPCVVLAGGLGTRLRPLTDGIPKALVPVLGRPFVEWQLDLLAGGGVAEVVFCIGYRGDMLRRHLGEGERWGLSVRWVDEGEDLRGTAGALRLACDEGALPPHFFVLYGDSYLPVELAEVERAWRRSGSQALMTVLRNDGRWDTSNAVYRDGRVVVYDKDRATARPEDLRWIDYGLSVLARDVVEAAVPSGTPADLADLLRDLSLSGRLAGLEVFQRFYEVGSASGLRDLEAHLAGL